MQAKEGNEPPGPGEEQSSARTGVGRTSPPCQELIPAPQEVAAPWEIQKHTSDRQKKISPSPRCFTSNSSSSVHSSASGQRVWAFINERQSLVLMRDTACISRRVIFSLSVWLWAHCGSPCWLGCCSAPWAVVGASTAPDQRSRTLSKTRAVPDLEAFGCCKPMAANQKACGSPPIYPSPDPGVMRFGQQQVPGEEYLSLILMLFNASPIRCEEDHPCLARAGRSLPGTLMVHHGLFLSITGAGLLLNT